MHSQDRSEIKQKLLKLRLRGKLSTHNKQQFALRSHPLKVRPAALHQVWAAAKSAGEQLASSRSTQLELAGYKEKSHNLDQCCIPYILRAMAELNLFQDGGKYTADELQARSQIRADYGRAFQRLLHTLVTEGLLVYDGSYFAAPSPLPALDPEPYLAQARSHLPELAELINFLQRSGENLAAILTGEQHAAQLLFLDGTLTAAEAIYTQSPPFQYCNQLGQAILAAIVQALPDSQHLNIVEIGAGTGATTAALLPVLPQERTTYLFTDVSQYFLELAFQKFKDYPFVDYAILDIEQSPPSILPQSSVHLVIATHVLHATRSLRETLTHVRSLLASQGILIVMEEAKFHPFFNLTMGLQTGFDRFADTELRPFHPLLTTAHWHSLLQEHGFSPVKSYPDFWGAQLFLAQAN